jgi:hypothetical protein
MNNKFTIVLGTTAVTFDLIESPVVESWRQILLDAKEHECDLFFSNKLLPTQTIQEISDSLSEIVLKLKNDFNFMLPEWNGVIGENFSQEELNRLHEEFHRQEDELGRSKKQLNAVSKELMQLLWDLNTTIHRLEYRKSNAAFCTASISYDQLNKIPKEKARIDITPEHRKCFTYNDKIDPSIHISLGYHTIGKCIHSCYADQDFDLIQKGLLSPQLKISSEFNIFANMQMTKERFLETQVGIKNWILENDKEGLVDLDLPENKYFLQPVLGTLSSETPFTEEEIIRLLSENTIDDYYFS